MVFANCNAVFDPCVLIEQSVGVLSSDFFLLGNFNIWKMDYLDIYTVLSGS